MGRIHLEDSVLVSPSWTIYSNISGSMTKKQTGLLGLVAGAAPGSVELFVTYVPKRHREYRKASDLTRRMGGSLESTSRRGHN